MSYTIVNDRPGKLFDNDGKLRDTESLQSVQFGGAGMHVPRTKIDRAADEKRIERIDQNTGKPNGYDIEYADGRRACIVEVDPVAVTPFIKET